MTQNYTVPAAAEQLGLSPHTLRTWIAARRIGYVRLGRAIRIPRTELDRIVSEGEVPALRTHRMTRRP